MPLSVWGDGALRVFDEPVMTVRVYGVVVPTPLSTSDSPVGEEANVRFVVCGCRWTLVVPVAQLRSVAVSLSSSSDGYSWSGAGKEPLATPV